MSDEPSAEERRLLQSFRELGIRPKAESKEDLEEWMAAYVASRAAANNHPVVPSSTTASEQPDCSGVTRVWSHQPRISVFSGSNGKESESTYDLWRYEISCLQADPSNTESAILEAIRRSLRGEAARVAMRLGPKITLSQLLRKFESVYGAVQLRQTILAEFYSASQREDEDTTQWSCRLEDLLARAVDLGEIERSQTDETLRCRLWTGLRPELKDRTAHKFDRILDVDELRRAIRQVEQETPRRRAAVRVAKADSDNFDCQLKKLTAKLKSLRQEVRQRSEARPFPEQGRRSGYTPATTQPPMYPTATPQPQEPAAERNTQRYRPGWTDNGPVCFRCGQEGHMKIGCRVRLDHSRCRLNYRQSASEGGL